jgi:peroxin-6
MYSRFTLHPSLSLQRVSEGLPFTYTGADMYALCSDAMLKAITRSARMVDEKVKAYNTAHSSNITIAYFFDHIATEEDTAVMVTEEDFMEAHKELVPSVTADELRHYNRVRMQFEGAGKKEERQKADDGPVPQQSSSSKGKGKAAESINDANSMIIQTENIDLNGDGEAFGGSSKGKGKAPASNHGGKSSVDIAEGGFGDSTEDGDLYS